MPIHLTDDPNDGQNDDFQPSDNNRGGGGSKFGGLLQFLPFILGFLIKKPKLLIVVLLIAGGFYFFKSCGGGSAINKNQSNQKGFSTGVDLKPEEYQKADIFNFLEESPKSNPLPESYSLEKYCPSRLNQGAQGSCVAWSNAYSARTILYARQTGKDPNAVAFSPSFMYNQIKLGNDCQGSYIIRAVELQSKLGGVFKSDFPYNEGTCSTPIPSELKDKAQNFKILGATRIGEDASAQMKQADLFQIKKTIASGAPVAIGMMVGGTFMQEMMGSKVWHPTQDDYDEMDRSFGGHAMTIVGYDDNLEGGAFQIMNSWGPEWGINGFGWVRYRDFLAFNREAYAYAPMGTANEVKPNIFDVNFGLVLRDGGKEISLTNSGNGVFTTNEKIPANTSFKIRLKNNIECYAYLFGQNTDNSSYVLYPQTEKHSAFCGVTGTRVFPHKQSLTPDNIGTTDYFAILISKKPIDHASVNTKINANKNADFAAAIRAALAGQLISNVNFRSGTGVSFTADAKDDKMVLVVIAVKK